MIGVSSVCAFCGQSLRAHQRLAELALAGGLNVVWVASDTLEMTARGPYTALPDGSLAIYEPTYATYRAIGLGSTPTALVLDEAGVIENVWIGLVRSEVENAIATHLSRPTESIGNTHIGGTP